VSQTPPHAVQSNAPVGATEAFLRVRFETPATLPAGLFEVGLCGQVTAGTFDDLEQGATSAIVTS